MTPARVRELLIYDPLTGVFTWRTTRGPFIAGEVAGSLKTDGYWRIGLDGRQHYAHRLAWAYMTGVWPVRDIDHRDRTRSNNIFKNLREATSVQNAQNCAPRIGSSGYPGVTKCRTKWQAQINADNEYHYLGVFPTAPEAHAAYLEAKARLHLF